MNFFSTGHHMRKFNSIFLLISLLVLGGCSPRTAQMGGFSELEAAPAEHFAPLYRPSFSPLPLKKEATVAKTYPRIENPITIVIDPGHGGKDLGTTAEIGLPTHEKVVNLATAQMLQTYLQQMGFRTLMTRQRDVFISLSERCQYANEQNADLYISVHYNSAPSDKAHGIEVFYFNSLENIKRANASKELAKSVLDNVISLTGAKSRGVKHGNLAVIRETSMPAILIEGGFFTNADEYQKIKDPAYQKKIAWGIALGVNKFVTGNKNFLTTRAEKKR